MFELIAGLLVAIFCMWLVLEPLVRLRPDAVDQTHDWSDLDEIDSPKVKALTAISEIDFDLATGKLSTEDHAALKARYAEEALAAIAVERQEDEQVAEPGDLAEAAIGMAREISEGACPICDKKLDPGAAFCSTCGCSIFAAESHARCWTCGSALEKEARFCSDCGSPATVSATVD